VEDYLTFTYQGRIVEFAAMSRLPAIYGLREFVDAGGLMSYGTDRRDLYRRSATYVHRILTGTSPANLPVERPTKVSRFRRLCCCERTTSFSDRSGDPMGGNEVYRELLFAYGTLQLEAVQMATFGRQLAGTSDALRRRIRSGICCHAR